MFKRHYFTDEDFELWIKTYNKAKYLIREYKYYYSIEQKQNHKEEFKEVNRIVNQYRVLKVALPTNYQKEMLDRFIKENKVSLKDNEFLIYRMTVDTWIDVVVNVPSNKLPNLDIKEFGKKLKEARLKQGYSRKRAAKILGMSDKSLQAYEEGNRTINVAFLYKMTVLLPEVAFIFNDFSYILLKY